MRTLLALTLLLIAGACSGGAAKTNEPDPLHGRWRGEMTGDYFRELLLDFEEGMGQVSIPTASLKDTIKKDSGTTFRVGHWQFVCDSWDNGVLSGTWKREGSGKLDGTGTWEVKPSTAALLVDLNTGVAVTAEITAK